MIRVIRETQRRIDCSLQSAIGCSRPACDHTTGKGRTILAQDHFDLDSLAEYLHISPQHVQKLATRGRIPGRRVGGVWRFSRAEIHHWLEDRIGISDEDELARVDKVVTRAHPDTIRIGEIMMSEGIATPLAGKTRNRVIDSMCELAAATGLLWDPLKMAEAVHAREELHSTALDNGVALLHPRRPMPNVVGEPLLAFGRTPSGIPFGGSQGGLTDLFFLICATTDSEHLCILSRLSRLINEETFLSRLREAETPHDVLTTVQEVESELND